MTGILSTKLLKHVHYVQVKYLDARNVLMTGRNVSNAMTHRISFWTIQLISVCVRRGISCSSRNVHYARVKPQAALYALNKVQSAHNATNQQISYTTRQVSFANASNPTLFHQTLNASCAHKA